MFKQAMIYRLGSWPASAAELESALGGEPDAAAVTDQAQVA